MGCFDEVRVPCAHCGQPILTQSKAGDCSLTTYNLTDAPIRILADIDGDTLYCEECHETFTVVVQAMVTTRKW